MEDEKEHILYALDTFRALRKSLLYDTKEKNIDLYMGLHSEGTMAENYIDCYKIDWLLRHFEKYISILDEKVDAQRKDYKEQSIEYFSRLLNEFIKQNESMVQNPQITISLLRKVEYILDDIINCSVDWDKRYKELCLEKFKNQEQYKKMLNQAMKK